MIDFHNQQIRDSIAPVFQPEHGIDYTGRMRDVESADIAGYEVKPFEYTDAAIPETAVNLAATAPPSPVVFREFFMQKYRTTQKYDFLKALHTDQNAKPGKEFQVGQVVMHLTDKISALVCVADNRWVNLGALENKDLPNPISPADIPIPEKVLCLCIKNSDFPLVEVPGTKRNYGDSSDYDDTDYFFLYKENGQTYMQLKNHSENASDYMQKPAMGNAWLEATQK